MGGSGYALVHIPDENGKPTIVPSVTTITGILDKPGLLQYQADEVAIKAVHNIDALLNRSIEEGFNFLRWAGKNKTKYAAAVGSNIHAYIASDLAGRALPAIEYPETAEMVGAWNAFKWEHSIVPLALEATVVNRDLGIAGTGDCWALVDGVATLLDWKSGKHTYPDHKAQMAALGSCDEMYVLDPEGEFEYVRTPPEGWFGETREVRGETKAVTRWRIETPPDISAYALAHIRPSGYDEHDEPHGPFVKLHPLSDAEIEAGWMRFNGCLQVKKAEKVEGMLKKEAK
jgi:hypothetical protein